MNDNSTTRHTQGYTATPNGEFRFYNSSLEITGENLEDLLAYDDHFLDYFNCFLALPVFPQALVYNRLTGAFDEVEGLHPEFLGSLPVIAPSIGYGPTDMEREKMLEWAREERLPLFLRTHLFRELKLVKLLLRPLEAERQSASRGSSRNIRGYSRATESYVSSLSISGENSGDIYDYDDIWGELNYSALYRYQRPGSRALSLPAQIIFDNQSYGLPSSIDSATTRTSENSTTKALSALTSRRFGAASTVQFAEFPEKPPDVPPPGDPSGMKAVLPSSGKTTETARQRARISNKVEVIPDVGRSVGSKSKSSFKSSYKSKAPASSTEEAFIRGARVLSAPVNYEHYIKMPVLGIHDFEALFGEQEPELEGHSYVQFDEEGISDEQTETDMRNMEGRLKMTIRQLKEKMFASHAAFEEFQQFLHGTMGEHLLAFWLDCENYKDTMEDFDDIENMEIRNAHFRDIQDKFKLKLTPDARNQITRAASNMGLSHTIFIRTQYDVLRRLRAYWVPRFLIHCERTRKFNLDDDNEMVESALPMQPSKPVEFDARNMKPAASRTNLPFFPCISLVHSMPVLPEDARDYAIKMLSNVEYENGFPRRMFPRQRTSLSARSRVSVTSTKRPTKERFLMALAADRLAGGPFQRYLAKLDDPQFLASLLFWEDVTEYGVTEDNSADRLLRLCHVWNIYNKYLSEDSPHRIDLPEKQRVRLHASLEKARDFMEASIFDNAKTQAVEKLEKAWIRYLKEDLKTFLDCRVKPGGESPPSTAEAIEITVTEYDVLIKRPRPWVRRVPGSSSSERARRLGRALNLAEEMDDERRAARRAEILARRKEMERERRKAIRAAYARQREAKRKKPSAGSNPLSTGDDLVDGEDGEKDGERSEKVPTFNDMSGNRQIMSMFRKFVNEGDNKDVHNQMHLYSDIEAYFALKENKVKKDGQALHISKMYLDSSGKKYTAMNEKIAGRLATEKDRPKSGLLREIQRAVLPRVEEVFKDFITKQAEEFGMDPRDLANMSQSELAMRMGNDAGMLSGWNKRKSRGKDEGDGKPDSDKNGKDKNDNRPQKIGELDFSSVKINIFESAQKHGRGTSSSSNLNKSEATTSKLNRRTMGRATIDKKPKRNVTSLKPISEVDETKNSASAIEKEKIPSQSSMAGLDLDDLPLLLDFESSMSSSMGDKLRTKQKTTGRAQATREDKNEFLIALGQSAMGHPSPQMLYFYKYLLKHGEEDGIPQIDKDLFFYIEVQKFKDGSHQFSDDEMLKRKVQSIVDCFLDSVYSPTLQVDIPSDMHQKTLKAAQRYLSGKEVLASLFDDAQFHVFKELLFYWAGYKRAIASTPEDPKKRPITKYDKMLKKRMENIENYQVPSSDFNLPSIPEGAIPSFTISLSEGVRFKEIEDSLAGTPMPDTATAPSKDRRASKATLDGTVKRSRNASRRGSIVARS